MWASSSISSSQVRINRCLAARTSHPWRSARRVGLLLVILNAAVVWGAEPEGSHGELIAQTQAALAANDLDQALQLAERAVRLGNNDPRARLLRAQVRELRHDFAGAAEDYSNIIEREGAKLDVKSRADLYHRRGDARLFAAQFEQSVADFNEEIRLIPARSAGHWQRGIACYYARQFDEGARQFEQYQKVDGNDVENAVWWFLCRAQSGDLADARRQILPIGRDGRVPLMTVYDLFLERAQPADVLAAVEVGAPDPQERKRRSFYAHLYLGLWHEALGRPKESLDHMRRAADEYNVGGYMWQVARLHCELRQGGSAAATPGTDRR
jgi:lipoprotein NlpI